MDVSLNFSANIINCVTWDKFLNYLSVLYYQMEYDKRFHLNELLQGLKIFNILIYIKIKVQGLAQGQHYYGYHYLECLLCL